MLQIYDIAVMRYFNMALKKKTGVLIVAFIVATILHIRHYGRCFLLASRYPDCLHHRRADYEHYQPGENRPAFRSRPCRRNRFRNQPGTQRYIHAAVYSCIIIQIF